MNWSHYEAHKIMTPFHRKVAVCLATASCVLTGCTVGPKYHRPSVDSPPAYKELTPADYKNTDGWKIAQPSDTAIRGKWWEVFSDPELNDLEEQVSVSNQNIAAAAASFLAARAIVKEARSQLFPTVAVSPSITESQSSSTLSRSQLGTTGTTAVVTNSAFTDYLLPFDASYQVDLWGRIRNQVNANAYAAQASAADLQNVRLTAQAEVAVDYFQIRAQDSQKQLLDEAVKAYQEALDLNKVLFETGIASDETVAQAETQLEIAEAQDTDLDILRAQFEHAIAVLVGKPASSFSIPREPLKTAPPAVPIGVPSQLLERRPDISAAERTMAQSNAQIGVAQAAYYPSLTLSASAGLETSSIAKLFTWPSRFFSVGPAFSETLFDGGLRRATVQQFRATFDQNMANYRQTVLTSFQQVEDNLASLRILSQEVQQQDTAVQSAQRTLTLAFDRYRLGLDSYLNVIVAQTTLYTNQRTALNLRMEQMTSSVQLIEALGGGWDSSQLPSPSSLNSKF
jgi:NodT family efflux transporter outer membrane factor (OMF) lipoprotein